MSSSDIDDPLPPDRDPRRVGAVFAAVLLLAVVAAIVIPTVEAGAKAPSGLTAAGAASTVRQFVDQAVVQGDGYTACALLTSPEQAAIARLGGAGDECRAVLGGDTSLLGVSTASDITGLDLHTTVHGATAVESPVAISCGIPGHDRPGEELRTDLMQVNDSPLIWGVQARCGFATSFAYHSEN